MGVVDLMFPRILLMNFACDGGNSFRYSRQNNPPSTEVLTTAYARSCTMRRNFGDTFGALSSPENASRVSFLIPITTLDWTAPADAEKPAPLQRRFSANAPRTSFW